MSLRTWGYYAFPRFGLIVILAFISMVVLPASATTNTSGLSNVERALQIFPELAVRPQCDVMMKDENTTMKDLIRSQNMTAFVDYEGVNILLLTGLLPDLACSIDIAVENGYEVKSIDGEYDPNIGGLTYVAVLQRSEQNTTMTTEDDGYTYPANATEEEKKAIDAQEYKAWIEAGRPGELVK